MTGLLNGELLNSSTPVRITAALNGQDYSDQIDDSNVVYLLPSNKYVPFYVTSRFNVKNGGDVDGRIKALAIQNTILQLCIAGEFFHDCARVDIAAIRQVKNTTEYVFEVRVLYGAEQLSDADALKVSQRIVKALNDQKSKGEVTWHLDELSTLSVLSVSVPDSLNAPVGQVNQSGSSDESLIFVVVIPIVIICGAIVGIGLGVIAIFWHKRRLKMDIYSSDYDRWFLPDGGDTKIDYVASLEHHV